MGVACDHLPHHSSMPQLPAGVLCTQPVSDLWVVSQSINLYSPDGSTYLEMQPDANLVL